MVNQILEKMIENAEVNSETAKSLRDRLSFLSSPSQSDVNFILKKIKIEKNTLRILNEMTKYKPENTGLLRYKKALEYAVDKAPDLDKWTVVARTSCIEKRKEFWYKPSDLEYSIGQIRKYKKMKRN